MAVTMQRENAVTDRNPSTLLCHIRIFPLSFRVGPVTGFEFNNNKGVAVSSDNAPVVNDLVGLEAKLPDEVYVACCSTLRSDQTEGGRIEIRVAVHEVRMVQDVDGRHLNLEPDSFGDWNSLRHTQVEVKVIRTIETVHREIAESTGCRSRHQAGL